MHRDIRRDVLRIKRLKMNGAGQKKANYIQLRRRPFFTFQKVHGEKKGIRKGAGLQKRRGSLNFGSQFTFRKILG